MSQKSKIEWTDATWNPVRGCTKVSPGCKHCYAETFAERWRGVPGHPYAQGFDLRLAPEKLAEPLKWRKPRRVFVNSMSDLFHKDVPNEYIAAVFGVMAATQRHTYQVLTKRSARLSEWFLWYEGTSGAGAHATAAMYEAKAVLPGSMPDLVRWAAEPNWPLPNVWLGVSVEDQERADERIPGLLATPAEVRFVSCEPLLGPLDLSPWLPSLDWVIVGGESGPKARPMDLAWARSIVEQCKEAGVACFVKQLGARPTCEFGERVRLRGRKGGDPAEWPEYLRVREWPAVSGP